jgi:hypothetical protein
MGSLKLITPLVSGLILWALVFPFQLFAANICDPVTGANCAGVNSTATGGGIHTSEYDIRSQFTGQKRTYSAATTALTATAAGTGPFFTICGSGTTTVRLQQFNINGSVATTAVRQSVTLRKTSTATSAGTATALVQVPRDSGSAAGTASLVNFYTVLATAGTLVGTVGTKTKNWPITATMASTDYNPEMIWDFRGREMEAIVLRGTAQCLEAGFAATTTNAPTLALSVTWTEE